MKSRARRSALRSVDQQKFSTKVLEKQNKVVEKNKGEKYVDDG